MSASGPRADGDQIAPRLGHRLFSALARIGGAIALGAVGGQREPLRPVAEPDHRGVAAGTLDRIAEDQRVILLVDPALRAKIGRAEQLEERRVRRHRRRDRGRVEDGRARGLRPRPVIERRLVAELLDRQVRLDLAAAPDDEPPRIGRLADDREIEPPFAEDGLGLLLLLGPEHHQHALLALGEHHLVGAHAGLAARHAVEVELDAEIALGAHLGRRRGEPRRAHVLNGDHRAGGHQLEAGFEQQLLGERIADLDGRAPLFGVRLEGRRRHARAVDAVAPGLRAEIDDRIADARRRRGEDRVPPGDADRHRVDEDVAVIAPMEADRAADRRHAERIAVAADPRDDSGHQAPGLRMIGRAEAQEIERGDGPCAHGEDVAQNAADPGRRALIGLDERGMVVALHLEHADIAVADVDRRPRSRPARR